MGSLRLKTAPTTFVFVDHVILLIAAYERPWVGARVLLKALIQFRYIMSTTIQTASFTISRRSIQARVS